VRFPITEHVVRTPRHVSFFLACGPERGTPLIFVHGWPELSISWQHSLRCFGSLGFRAIAPDMRGYGRSTVYGSSADYTVEAAERDMLELLDATGHRAAIWVGHDWGTPVVWSLAAHHAERCLGVAGLCVPYLPAGFAPETLVPLVDRALYPADRYPAGQWEYQLHYREAFERAVAVFDADPVASVKALFRGGRPASRGKPARLAEVRRDGGWFGGAARAPDLPLDTDLIGIGDLHRYASALQANGFAGPCSWYLNGPANLARAAAAPHDGRLSVPVLFLHGAHDFTCDTTGSRLAEPMRAACPDLTELTVDSGHWMPIERPEQVNAGLAAWLARRLPDAWRGTAG
jgi:pimeloyl-ACP methyl ester carboxylesterase